MLRFYAHQLINIGSALQIVLDKWDAWTPEERELLKGTILIRDLNRIAVGMDELGCKTSANQMRNLIESITSRTTGEAEVMTRAKCAQETMRSEMETHLFLWVDGERAQFYAKTPEELLGKECVSRFPSVIGEAEEAMRCYAVGRYTASAFHLMRLTEAGVRALGAAIKFKVKNENWGRILQEFRTQQTAENKPPHWKNRFRKLHTIGAHLQAVNHGWRNRIAHLDHVYTESQAKHLLTVVPAFLTEIANIMDENGKFY
jgi:hypothetical protein